MSERATAADTAADDSYGITDEEAQEAEEDGV